MIAVIDYGVGNLFSIKSSFARIGVDAVVTADKKIIQNADRIMLPGVGAFEDAAKKLRQSGMADLLREEVKKGKCLMGICLGMQLLFEKSYEYGEHKGLGLIKGVIRPIKEKHEACGISLKVPQIGWNAVSFTEEDCPLTRGVQSGTCFYFVNSYRVIPEEEGITAGITDYGSDFCSMIHSGNIYAAQFHIEKSGEPGLKMLSNFAALSKK